MPNWCNNSFSITGNIESIKDLWEAAQTANDGEFGLLNAIAPIGEWEYGKAVDTWGTKWDVSDEGLEFIDNGDGTACITGWFESAWAPPIAAYEQLAADFDSCVIECSYYEPGMDFGGFWSSENGDEEFDNLQERLEQPVEEWDERFKEFEVEYDLLSEEWRFEEEEIELD